MELVHTLVYNIMKFKNHTYLYFSPAIHFVTVKRKCRTKRGWRSFSFIVLKKQCQKITRIKRKRQEFKSDWHWKPAWCSQNCYAGQ